MCRLRGPFKGLRHVKLTVVAGYLGTVTQVSRPSLPFMPPTVNDKSPLSPGRRMMRFFFFLLIPLVGRVFRFFQGQNVMRKI